MTQQEQEIINEYKNGKSFDYLTKKYHHKYETVKNILIKNDIHIRNKSEAGKDKNKVVISKETELKIIENYTIKQFGIKKSGEEFGISEYLVKKILIKNNIPIRTLHNSIIVNNKNRRKYFCNENYFKVQSNNMAYILGFLAADGTVSKSSNEIKITVSNKDKELLQKIKEELEYTGKIKESTTSDGFDIATLEITCQSYKEDLSKYNIIPNKTYTFSIPTTLNKIYWKDFIRGYFDGDGSVSTAGATAIRSQICSIRKTTLEQILDYLEEFYNIPKVNIYSSPRKNNLLYYFQYSTNSTKRFFESIYYDGCLCLKRKYDKFLQLIYNI